MIRVGSHVIGDRVFVVAEIGINHNGSLATACELIDAAAVAGANAVKFQVGNPDLYVTPDRRDVPRETPWGVMPYIEYRRRLEFSDADLETLRHRAHEAGLVWFASALDLEAVERLNRLDVPCHKVASPMLTDDDLLNAMRGRPILLSTGMSDLWQVDHAVGLLEYEDVVVMHCTSAYPCPPELANLRMITTLRERYGKLVGYSGHEVGVPETVAAVALGACVVERHLTLSRAMWGSDHAASLEPRGLATLVRYIRTVESAMGDGVKQVYAAEEQNSAKFRRFA